MHVMILGAGAIGGYFGGRLAESGADVSFLVREARKRQLLDQGLRITSIFGDYTAPVEALTAEEIKAPADIILLTCKAYDLPSAIDAIRPAVGEATTVLPLLNGLAHLDILNRAFGNGRVLGGLAKIAATLLPDGSIKHLNDWRFITFGEQDGRTSDRIAALKSAFDRTTIIATIAPDIVQAMWEKLVHLATAAGMTCLMRANVGEIARVAGGTDIILSFLETNADIARLEGYPPSASFLAEYRALFSDAASTYTASMLRDLERGGQVEADHIIGYMLEKARKHGLDTRLHQSSYVHLKAYEERRRLNRL